MDQLYMTPNSDCCASPLSFANVPDLLSCSYDSTTTDPSPSPPIMYASINNSSYTSYPSATSHPQYFDNLPQIANSIEFTDLTHPQLEDRRRRRSNTMDDKESVSNMRIRRRAQNRASQRAFRERKEKHVQHLERELEELETKYRNLSRSYTDLDSTHSKLKQEVDQLRDALKSSRQGSANSEPLQPPGNNFFDPFATDNFFGSEPHLRF